MFETFALLISGIVGSVVLLWNIFVGIVWLVLALGIGVAIGLKGTSRPPLSPVEDLEDRIRAIIARGACDAEIGRANHRNQQRGAING